MSQQQNIQSMIDSIKYQGGDNQGRIIEEPSQEKTEPNSVNASRDFVSLQADKKGSVFQSMDPKAKVQPTAIKFLNQMQTVKNFKNSA